MNAFVVIQCVPSLAARKGWHFNSTMHGREGDNFAVKTFANPTPTLYASPKFAMVTIELYKGKCSMLSIL